MPEPVRIWMEIAFNVAYLGVIWTLVIMMWRNRQRVAPADHGNTFVT